MKYLIDFLKSEGFLCLLITFLVCAFLGAWTGLVATLIMWICNMGYTARFSLYNTIGFGCGYTLSLFQKLI